MGEDTVNPERAPIRQEPHEAQNVTVDRRSIGDERRQALVMAAYDLIATKGFEGLRVRDVAARGGVNIATLHYYFPTKEALIGGVVQHLLHQFLTVAPRVPEGEEGTAAQRLERELIDLEYELRTAPEMWIVVMELQLRSLRDPAINAILKEMDAGWREHIAYICADGVREGLFDPGQTSRRLHPPSELCSEAQRCRLSAVSTSLTSPVCALTFGAGS